MGQSQPGETGHSNAPIVPINLAGNSYSHDIQGNAGANVLTGGSGDDVIQGLGGNDTLVGGGGHDVFVFANGNGQDIVSDFVSGTDQLDLRAFGFANFAAVQAATHDVGANAVIDLGGGNTVTLTGVLKAQLQSGDVLVSGLSNAAGGPTVHTHIESGVAVNDAAMAGGWPTDLATSHAGATSFLQVWMMPTL